MKSIWALGLDASDMIHKPSPVLITWSLLEDVYFLWRWKNEKGSFLKWGSADGWTIGAEGT